MPKLHHPTMNAITLDCEEITRGEDGTFEIPAEHVQMAVETFGFTELPAEPAGDGDPSQFMAQLAKKNKAEIAAYLLEAYEIEVDPDKHRKDDLLDMVVEAAAKAADAARLAELQAKAPEDLTPEEAEEMAALLPQDGDKE